VYSTASAQIHADWLLTGYFKVPKEVLRQLGITANQLVDWDF
jgi:hypothetical protein